MKKTVLSTLLAGAMMIGLAFPATAHGPTPQRVSHTVHIEAPARDVWRIVRDPAALPAWHPAVDKAVMDGEGRGAKRAVTLVSGGTILDGIDDVNEERMTIRWRLSREDVDVIPVSYYTNDITVASAGDGSDVAWRTSFFRADTTNEPEERYSDEAAVSAMELYVEKGLAGLKALAEQGD